MNAYIMNIAFRVDASSQIGTGHFMRCLTLADVLSQRGAQIRFISRHLLEHLQGLLLNKGYEFMTLESQAHEEDDDLAHSHWLGTTQQYDADEVLQLLSDRIWDWLVVDHYALDARWESLLRKSAKRLMVIDDLADRMHDCDILLDQNYYADMETRYTGKVPVNCQLLLGPHYALLREEFRQWRQQVRPRTGPVKSILVFFGGVDVDNFTGLTIEALAGLGLSGLHIDVVIGAQHPFREQIESDCSDHKFYCYVQTDRMAELMAKTDLAIGAGGSATWERCCLGLPALAISTASNQSKQVADAGSCGLLYAPEINDNIKTFINRHLPALIDNSNLIKFISNNDLQAVDGKGVSRVIRNLGCSGIEMRVAGKGDSEKIFEWRNHPKIRAVSRNREVISWEDHGKWFAKVLSSPDNVLLIGYSNSEPVGVVRFDNKDDEAEVSIYLVPGLKESGVGGDLLQCAEHWFSIHYPEIRKIVACVLGDNGRSNHLFLGAGYRVESTSYIKELA